MKNTAAVTNPKAFGFDSFADLLPSREPLIGEDLCSFQYFQHELLQTLAPATPYEYVVAENLVAIEWELVQHRRMRDASHLQIMRNFVKAAVVKEREAKYKAGLEKELLAHLKAGKSPDNWKASADFDSVAAEKAGEDLAQRAMSLDAKVRDAANKKIAALGLRPVDLMGEAYIVGQYTLTKHEDKLPELERRRRNVKRDYDLLQKANPLVEVAIEV